MSTDFRYTAQQYLGKDAAVARAIATAPVHDEGLRVWRHADAILVGNRWMCVIEDERTVYVVVVHPRTGCAELVGRGQSAQ